MTTGWTKTISHEQLTAKGSAVVRRGGKQLALFETPEGIFACNNRCPHEGYPLREGTLDGSCILTCNWHNWKFDLKTGANQYGGDGLRVYPVELRGGDVWVDITDPPFEARRAEIITNLREAFDDHEYDRIAREIARLRLVGGDPTDAVAEAIRWSYERFEFGWTHAYAGAADWLSLYDEHANDPETQLICLLEIVGHIADDTLREENYPYGEATQDYDEDGFVKAMEDEDEDTVMAMLRGGLAAGLSFPEFERGLSRAALAHYAAFGHCMIYVTKAGKLIERFGDRVAEPLLLSLARHTLFSSREDQIPEFRHYAEALAAWGQGRNGTAPEAGEFKGLNPKNAMKLAARHGKGDPEALYRALLAANADNMLHYDMAYQRQTDMNIRDNVGWLDFTHTITFANAARKTCAKFPELWPYALLQLACFSGRNDAYTDAALDDSQWRVDDADDFFNAGVEGLFDHGRDEYIVSVHYVKTLLAAREEVHSGAAGDAADTVLASLNRLVNSPLPLKHVRRTVHQAMEFVVLDG